MGASTWHGLVGVPGYAAGTSGTVTIPPKAVVLAITAHASSSGAYVTILGGSQIPIVSSAPPWSVDFKHALYTPNQGDGSGHIVFHGTDAYFVHWVEIGHGG